jgi:hypothetical protein
LHVLIKSGIIEFYCIHGENHDFEFFPGVDLSVSQSSTMILHAFKRYFNAIYRIVEEFSDSNFAPIDNPTISSAIAINC